MMDDVLDKSNAQQPCYGDSANTDTGPDQKGTMECYNMKDMTCEKRARSKPLTEAQKEKNHEISKIRAHVEYVFGFMERSMNGLLIRTVGLRRVTTTIGLINLTYNLFWSASELSRKNKISDPPLGVSENDLQ